MYLFFVVVLFIFLGRGRSLLVACFFLFLHEVSVLVVAHLGWT